MKGLENYDFNRFHGSIRQRDRKYTLLEMIADGRYIMARSNAREERWEGMEIRGIQGYFCDLRIDRATVPDYFNFWELADGDCNGAPCRYRQGILVNFYGTFLTTGELPVDDRERQEGFINNEDEWGFTDGFYSFPEIEQMERGDFLGGV